MTGSRRMRELDSARSPVWSTFVGSLSVFPLVNGVDEFLLNCLSFIVSIPFVKPLGYFLVGPVRIFAKVVIKLLCFLRARTPVADDFMRICFDAYKLGNRPASSVLQKLIHQIEVFIPQN